MILDKTMTDALKEASQCHMVGVLAIGESSFPWLGDKQDAITPQKNSDAILFYIRPLSLVPNPIQKLDEDWGYQGKSTLYIGFDYTISTKHYIVGPEYKHTRDINQRMTMLNDYFKNKLVLFRPRMSIELDQVHKNLDIIQLEDCKWDENTIFIPIPKYTGQPKEFENLLRSGKPINFPEYNHQYDNPEYVLCGDFIYYLPNFIKDPTKKTSWVFKGGEIRRLDLTTQNRVDQMIIVDEHLEFYKDSFLHSLGTLFQSVEEEPVKPAIEIKATKASATSESTQTAEEDTNYSILESHFIKSLETYTLHQKLYFDREDLVNFHISVKTNALTILAGMSGMGKSQLAMNYAQALGMSQDNSNGNLLVIPISPAYTEPGDVLGYLNTSTGLYMAAETGLVDFLVHASDNPNMMHMVIFDEMNLSQVEHWFSPFISLLELKPEERKLRLYSKNAVCHNETKYPREVLIGDNVLFVGTINVDETTKTFSDRLLDRANVVSLQKMPFTSLKEIFADLKEIQTEEALTVFSDKSTYREWTQTENPWENFKDEELEWLESLHNLIQKYDPQKGVSFRILDRMGAYIQNIPLNDSGTEPELSVEDAFDIQIKQRVLTKLRGPIEQLGDLIGRCDGPDAPVVDSELYDFFTSKVAQSISHFERSIQEIRRKAREMTLNEYAS